jgi:hypothetical protein
MCQTTLSQRRLVVDCVAGWQPRLMRTKAGLIRRIILEMLQFYEFKTHSSTSDCPGNDAGFARASNPIIKVYELWHIKSIYALNPILTLYRSWRIINP